MVVEDPKGVMAGGPAGAAVVIDVPKGSPKTTGVLVAIVLPADCPKGFTTMGGCWCGGACPKGGGDDSAPKVDDAGGEAKLVILPLAPKGLGATAVVGGDENPEDPKGIGGADCPPIGIVFAPKPDPKGCCCCCCC